MTTIVDSTNGVTFPDNSVQAKSGQGPVFSAYLGGATQTLTSGVFAKLLCNTEEFDVGGFYDNTTNYRFQPTVAGYYAIKGASQMGGATNTSQVFVSIYKNGAEFKRGSIITSGIAGGNMGSNVDAVIFFNGSTDYVELWGICAGTGAISAVGGAPGYTYFQGHYIRG